MANIPGIAGYVQPNTFSRVRTIRRSVSIPGGLRILAILGLGRAEETVVLNANGGGADGSNPNFAGTDSPDGRHFGLAKTNLISARTQILKNSIPLSGFEDTIDTDPFDDRYDYRLEIATGRIELQQAHLVDQGGSYAPSNANNVGDGSVASLELIDANAPAETWNLRVTSVVRDSYGDPIPEVAVFTAIGSVTGQVMDAYGAPITFISDGTIRDNDILRLSITEGTVPFERGDRFSIIVDSGVLAKGDLLEARYIATEDIEDPEFFTDASALYAKHGYPSEDNTLSLGSAMAFENGAPGIMALQAKPALPRRTSEVLLERDNPLTDDSEGFPNIATPVTNDDRFYFNYTLSGVPDTDTAVNIFVVDRTTGVSTQIFPTKVDFYNTIITADPYNDFISNANYSYSYTVILDGEVEDEGNDGAVTAGSSDFTAASGSFAAYNVVEAESDTYKQIRIYNRDRYDNDTSDVAGLYGINSVGGGLNDDSIVTLDIASFAATKTDLVWELVDPADTSARLLITTDLYSGGTIQTRDGLSASFITTQDADYFDTNWAASLEKLEEVECQIVVPLPDATYSNIQQACRAHCELMSNTANQKERMLLTGAQQGVTSAALIGTEQVAVENVGVIEGIQGDDASEVLVDNIEDLQDFQLSTNWGTTYRVVYFWPDEIIRVINGTPASIHGFYTAAAAGGWLAGQPNVAIPLTRKILTGFSIARSKLRSPTILNSLGNEGVSVLQPVTGGGQILHCKTTISGGDATEEEPSVIFIRDRTAQVLRAVLRGFIGQVEDPTLVASITASCQKALQALTAQGLLSSYRSLSVSRDDVDARQWNVVVDVQPNLPVNWISIDISVGIF